MLNRKDRNEARKRRHRRMRRGLAGSQGCPRLNVFRSARHIYAQLVDDEAGITLTAASSLDPQTRATGEGTGTRKVQVARQVGALIAHRALEKGISRVVFDRGGYQYHGRVQALADAAREAGLQF
ncbi:MAG: 50S ribosomal protein L18 [bacterium]|nr:50S ribosomal protein L18 [bacterium]